LTIEASGKEISTSKEGEFVSGVRDSAAFRDLNTLGVENNIEEDKNPRQVTF
jgi:hypothetical protein